MSPPTILIVDDDVDFLETLAMILEGAGYQVVTASNGLETLDLLHAGAKPDLILLDLMMPGMDGWSFRQLQLGERAWADIPVVVLSGDHDALAKTPPQPVAACLPKPLDLATLERVVAHWISSGPCGTVPP